jgi:hypothetical protein
LDDIGRDDDVNELVASSFFHSYVASVIRRGGRTPPQSSST